MNGPFCAASTSQEVLNLALVSLKAGPVSEPRRVTMSPRHGPGRAQLLNQESEE